jgi:nitroreductase
MVRIEGWGSAPAASYSGSRGATSASCEVTLMMLPPAPCRTICRAACCPGFDQVLQCLSGMAVFQGGGPDKAQVVLGSVLDYFTSALLAYGVASALFYRERSGTSGSSIYPAVQNMLLAARALGLGATLTTLYLQFEKEAEAALGLPPGVHSYALLPIGYPMGRFGPVRRVPLADVVYEDRWGEPYRDL